MTAKSNTARGGNEARREAATPEALLEIEKVASEAKGKIALRPGRGFWETRTYVLGYDPLTGDDQERVSGFRASISGLLEDGRHLLSAQ